MAEPSYEQWKTLYWKANDFRVATPWVLLSDESMFAVEDPETGTVGYCVILGNAGMEFGLAIYVGPEGLDGARRLMSGEVDPETFDYSTSIRSISMQFGSKDSLEERDLRVVRMLGVTRRDPNAWPLFRSLVPGYFPWYLDADECRLLEIAIAQSSGTAWRAKLGEIALTSGLDDSPIFMRCLRDGEWVDEWRVPPDLDSIPEPPLEPVNELRLKRLRESKTRGDDRWQLDRFRLPDAVRNEEDRPYFPDMFMGVNRQGFIVCAELFEPAAPASVVQDFVTGLLEQNPRLPGEIQVESKKLLRILRPVAEPLRIRIRVANLNDFHQVRDEFMSLQSKLDGEDGPSLRTV